MLTSQLTKKYGSFFSKVNEFSTSPYTYVFTMGTNEFPKNDSEWLTTLIFGGVACAVLTVIPVLPIFTAITASLALLGAIAAALSTLITYPVALAIDACSDLNPSASI